MIEQQWDATNAILTIHPQSPLHTSDFAALASITSTYKGSPSSLIHPPTATAVCRHGYFVRERADPSYETRSRSLTFLTPGTAHAACRAAAASDSDRTVPLSVTVPSSVSTSMLLTS